MSFACRPLLFALAALLALTWPDSPALAFVAVPRGVAAAEQDTHHGEGVAHCATGAGGGCLVSALCGAASVLLSHPKATRGALPVSKRRVALIQPGPPAPIPIG